MTTTSTTTTSTTTTSTTATSTTTTSTTTTSTTTSSMTMTTTTTSTTTSTSTTFAVCRFPVTHCLPTSLTKWNHKKSLIEWVRGALQYKEWHWPMSNQLLNWCTYTHLNQTKPLSSWTEQLIKWTLNVTYLLPIKWSMVSPTMGLERHDNEENEKWRKRFSG